MTHHVISKELNAELMLYDTEEDAVHVLNPTARRVYELHVKGMSLDDMAGCIREEFHMDPEKEITADLEACLQELREKDLV
jgi:hypothetical protein